MKVQIVGRVVRIDGSMQSSYSGNDYFSFHIEDTSGERLEGTYKYIKCYYMIKDVYKGEQIRKAISLNDRVFITGTLRLNQGLVDGKQTLSLNIFVSAVEIVFKPGDLQNDKPVNFKPKEIKENLSQTKLPAQKELVFDEKNHSEQEKQEFLSKTNSVLDNLLYPSGGNSELPF